jgi:hypothetical protein
MEYRCGEDDVHRAGSKARAVRWEGSSVLEDACRAFIMDWAGCVPSGAEGDCWSSRKSVNVEVSTKRQPLQQFDDSWRIASNDGPMPKR